MQNSFTNRRSGPGDAGWSEYSAGADADDDSDAGWWPIRNRTMGQSHDISTW